MFCNQRDVRILRACEHWQLHNCSSLIGQKKKNPLQIVCHLNVSSALSLLVTPVPVVCHTVDDELFSLLHSVNKAPCSSFQWVASIPRTLQEEYQESESQLSY